MNHNKEEKIQSVLPKLDGLLALSMPSSAIEAAALVSHGQTFNFFQGVIACSIRKCPHCRCLVTEDSLFSYKKSLKGMLIHLKVYQTDANLFTTGTYAVNNDAL